MAAAIPKSLFYSAGDGSAGEVSDNKFLILIIKNLLYSNFFHQPEGLDEASL